MHTNKKCCVYVLLYYLEPNGELHTTCDVQTAVVQAEEHGDVCVTLGVLLLECDVRDDVFVLALSVWSFDAAVLGAQPAEDLAGFFKSSHFDKPAWRLWY